MRVNETENDGSEWDLKYIATKPIYLYKYIVCINTLEKARFQRSTSK